MPPPWEDNQRSAVLPWEGAAGGDARLRVLVPMLRAERNPSHWSLVATHLPGRSARACRDRYGGGEGLERAPPRPQALNNDGWARREDAPLPCREDDGASRKRKLEQAGPRTSKQQLAAPRPDLDASRSDLDASRSDLDASRSRSHLVASSRLEEAMAADP